MYEKIGNDCEMFYRYDPDGRLGLVFQCDIADGAKHYYYPVTNSRGDIMEIHNGPGQITAKYNYDAWGKLLSVTDANGNVLPKTHFAYKISVRYRGYEYDAETGLYYLQSRYYDPETGRFINADDANFIGITNSEVGYNLFPYCGNDPVNRCDNYGYAYSPANAKTYADKWWNKRNPAYKANSSDCANFVSQCLYAGGLSKMTGVGKYGWHHYRYANAVSNAPIGMILPNYQVRYLYQISNAWGTVTGLRDWLKNNNHVKKEYILKNKSNVTSLVKELKSKKNNKYCIAAVFFQDRNRSIGHAGLSGQIEIDAKKNVYDIYYYGHTEDRNGHKRKYTNKKGDKVYISIYRYLKDSPGSTVYFCILK